MILPKGTMEFQMTGGENAINDVIEKIKDEILTGYMLVLGKVDDSEEDINEITGQLHRLGGPLDHSGRCRLGRVNDAGGEVVNAGPRHGLPTRTFGQSAPGARGRTGSLREGESSDGQDGGELDCDETISHFVVLLLLRLVLT